MRIAGATDQWKAIRARRVHRIWIHRRMPEPGYRNEVTTNGQARVEVHHIPKDACRQDFAWHRRHRLRRPSDRHLG